MPTGDQPTSIEFEDETGDIRVSVDSRGVPTVELGFAVKASFEHIQFSFTTLMLLNRALGEFRAQQIRSRSRSLVPSTSSPESQPYSVDERIERLHARVTRAREAIRSAREGEGQPEAASAGRPDRIWLEGRGGFVLELRIDSDFYASFSAEVIGKELNECLEQLLANGDVSAATVGSWDDERKGTDE